MDKRKMIPAVIFCIGSILYIRSKRSMRIEDSIINFFKNRGVEIVNRINNFEYSECYRDFDDEMKKSMPEERLANTFKPVLSAMGDLLNIDDIDVYTNETLGDEYIICEVNCSYTKGPLTYKIVFNRDAKTSGLHLK